MDTTKIARNQLVHFGAKKHETHNAGVKSARLS